MVKILYFITDVDPISLELAREHIGQEVGICLLQDAVYFAHSTEHRNRILTEALHQKIPVFAAKRDIQSRGLTNLVHPEVQLLDYGGIIDLVFDYDRIVNF